MLTVCLSAGMLSAGDGGKADCERALRYAEGVGAKQDLVEAVKWFRKAAEQGNAKAQCPLGLCLILGKGAERNSMSLQEYKVLAENKTERN